jgi:uncharacterized protein (DUF58 family)
MNEFISKIKNLDLRLLKISNNLFNGKYRSIFKGNGIDFLEYKKYEYGDDTKYIDWKLSLRKGSLYKKKFIEERNINIILVVDISSSMIFLNKRKITLDFCFFISNLSLNNDDNLSLLLFNDNIVEYVKPKNTRNSFLNILNILSNVEIKNNYKTNIKNCLDFINKRINKKSVIFFISDFISNIDYENEIKICKNKHDFIAVVIDVEEESRLDTKSIGILEVYNPEKNKYIIIDTSLNETFHLYCQENRKKLINLFYNNSIDSLFINQENFLLELSKFFNFRKRKY